MTKIVNERKMRKHCIYIYLFNKNILLLIWENFNSENWIWNDQLYSPGVLKNVHITFEGYMPNLMKYYHYRHLNYSALPQTQYGSTCHKVQTIIFYLKSICRWKGCSTFNIKWWHNWNYLRYAIELNKM